MAARTAAIRTLSAGFRPPVLGRGSRNRLISARLFSSVEPVSETHHSWSSLGLSNSPLVAPHLQSVRQLPEVESALAGTENQVESLQRAIQVFSAMGPGGNEHLATLSLLAEAQERVGLYNDASKTLREIHQYSSGMRLPLAQTVDLALAKSLWLQGQFEESKLICDDMLDSEIDAGPLFRASARTGQAVSRLLLASSLDDVFSVRDPFRMVVKSLEGYPSLTLAAAHLNYGVAEAVYAEIVSKSRDVEAPLDGAMRSWKQGLTALKKVSRKEPRSASVAAQLEARLNTNMAWGLLQMTRERDYLERSSEFSSQALKIYDQQQSKPGLGRTLALIATTYHRSGGAVTAEGLYQSAMDQPIVSPNDKLEFLETLHGYAELCKNWEKRERDAQRLEEKIADVAASLPEGWQEKSVIYSSLWFWNPSNF